MSDKYKEASKFISENMKLFSEKDTPKGKAVVFNVNQAQYAKFMKARGIDKSTMEAFHDAQAEYSNGATSVLTDELLSRDDSYSVTIRTSTPVERLDLGVYRSRTHNNPKEGGKITKYGQFFRDTKQKVFDQDILDNCRKAIEKATK